MRGRELITPSYSITDQNCFLMIMSTLERVIHTPGHTTDSVVYYSENDRVLFSGDTIFKASIGNTRFPGGDYDTLVSSIIHKIFTLPEDTVIYSGHSEPTSVGTEKRRYF